MLRYVHMAGVLLGYGVCASAVHAEERLEASTRYFVISVCATRYPCVLPKLLARVVGPRCVGRRHTSLAGPFRRPGCCAPVRCHNYPFAVTTIHRPLIPRYLDGLEAFDRGWYAGPFGWISGAGAEFVVAIRSGLVTPDMAGGPALAAEGPAAPAATAVLGAAAPVPAAAAPAAAPGPALAPSPPVQLAHLYAGVGVVRGSDPTAEWQELDLKVWDWGWGSGRCRVLP